MVQLVNCGLSNITIEALHAKGIQALFPIQKHVYEPAAAGRDLIGRARTGSGKTLAFALPVVEKLLKVRHTHGPSVLACLLLVSMPRTKVPCFVTNLPYCTCLCDKPCATACTLTLSL